MGRRLSVDEYYNRLVLFRAHSASVYAYWRHKEETLRLEVHSPIHDRDWYLRYSAGYSQGSCHYIMNDLSIVKDTHGRASDPLSRYKIQKIGE